MKTALEHHHSRMGLRTVGTCALLLVGSLALANAGTLVFDFTRGSGDRAHYFGTSQTNNTFDNVASGNGFYVQADVFKSPNINGGSNPSTYWVVLNDDQPDTINASIPAGYESYLASSSSPLTMRSRVASLTSGDGGIASYGGFLFSLDDDSSTGSGILALVRRIPGNAAGGELALYNFTNGEMGSVIATSTAFNNSVDVAYFLDLSVDASGAYTLNLFSDASIAGTGNDSSRLLSSDFDTATPVASLSGNLTGYDSGYTGLFFHDDGGTNLGYVYYGNYYTSYTAVPEPGTGSLFMGSACALALMLRKFPAVKP